MMIIHLLMQKQRLMRWQQKLPMNHCLQTCIEYTGDNADTYKNDSNASLKTLVKKSSVDGDAADWLFDSTRKTGDVTVVSDSSASEMQCCNVCFKEATIHQMIQQFQMLL